MFFLIEKNTYHNYQTLGQDDILFLSNHRFKITCTHIKASCKYDFYPIEYSLSIEIS